MNAIKEYAEEIQAVVGVLLVGGFLAGLIPLEVLVPIMSLLGSTATATIKSKLKKAGKIAEKL